MNEGNNLNTNTKPLVEEKDADNMESTFVNHSFSGFKNYICVISTESTVLVRSGYSFVAVEVKV